MKLNPDGKPMTPEQWVEFFEIGAGLVEKHLIASPQPDNWEWNNMALLVSHVSAIACMLAQFEMERRNGVANSSSN